MPNVATITEVRQIGLAKETVRGTAEVAPTSFLSLTKDSNIDFDLKLIEDPALRGVNARFPSFPGLLDAKGPLKTPARAQNIGEFLHMAFGPVTSSTEQTSVTVTSGVNNKIDMVEDSDAAIHLTLTPGTYVMGASSAVSGSFCKLIKDIIEAGNGASTYTVAFSSSTSKMTITKNTGVFVINWLTGTNTGTNAHAIMGFLNTADTASAIAATSNSTVPAVFKHIFTSGAVVQLPSYDFYIDRGAFNSAVKAIKQYNLGSMQKLKFSGTFDGPVEMEASILAQQEAVYSGAWTPAYSESPVLMFNNSTVKVGGSAPSVPNVKSWSCELDPGMKEYRPLFGYQYAQDFLAAGPYKAQGDMIIYFMDLTERAKFLAATQTSLEFLIEGGLIGGSTSKYTLDLLLPSVEYEAFPFKDEDGFLGAAVKWLAHYSAASTFIAQAYVINSKSSY